MLSINTITHRGIVCIDTFPKELIWGQKNTALECSNCLHYATYKNILVGLCNNCALYSYNNKYGKGFINYPYTTNNTNEIAMCFGNIHPNQILDIKGLDYKQEALNYNHSYTIYNLSLSTKDELDLLLNKNFICYGLPEFQQYYNCDFEVLCMIIDKIIDHKLKFNIWSKEYYDECLQIETFYKNNTDYELNTRAKSKNKYQCRYCKSYKYKKELKKCSKCLTIYYCSISCQSRDWKEQHKLECIVDYSEDDKDSDDDEDTGEDID